MAPPCKEYRCQRVSEKPKLKGFLTGKGWEELPWTDEFVDITGNEELKPRFWSKVKMGWDDEYFYVGALMEEPHVWGTITKKNAQMFEDNDFEIFIDPDGDGLSYYEFEINALGTIWELSLPKPYKDGGKPVLGCNINGLISAIGVSGTLNDPGDTDEGWSVTVAIPWAGLTQYHKQGLSPPVVNAVWRVNFSRVQWQHEIVDGQYKRVPPPGSRSSECLNPEEQEHPEDNWVWSPQGAINMHMPERWGKVQFVE
ncbi:MAG: carbohydrate-binding family 9-like protein [Gammaproteobacteria bacterium]|nr:carbohydrate-binding family 9-like protein [Gammaproteobacteria bacterium]